MNKIYLKLKKDISIIISDGNWHLNIGDMIVLQKIGTKSKIIRNEYKAKATEYIHSDDSYILTGFEYTTIKDITSLECHTVWKECNSVDTLITISTGKPYYHSRTCTYSEIISNNKLNTILDNIRHDDLFEDLSIIYNRDNKIKEILQ
jgi:hypothetical protein